MLANPERDKLAPAQSQTTIAQPSQPVQRPRMRRLPTPGQPAPTGATPAAAPAPMRPAAPGSMVTTQAQPGQPMQDGNLQDAVFTPGGDPRLGGAQGATDAAANTVATAPGYQPMQQQGTERYRQLYGSGQVQAQSALGQGPNRTELALKTMEDFDRRDAENRHNRYRQIGQQAASKGRLGLGDTGMEFINQGRMFEDDRNAFRNDLIRSVSEGDIGDRFRDRDFMTGVDERNQDRGFDRNRAATGDASQDAQLDLGDRYRRLGSAQGYEDQVFGQGQSNRDEYRGERDRQDGLEQRFFDNDLRRRNEERMDLDQRLRQSALQMSYGGR